MCVLVLLALIDVKIQNNVKKQINSKVLLLNVNIAYGLYLYVMVLLSKNWRTVWFRVSIETIKLIV